MLYNNKHETAYIRMSRNGKTVGEFRHAPYAIGHSLKEQTNGCLDPRKIDYFQIVQRSQNEEKEHVSARVYIGDVNHPLSEVHRKKYPLYFEQELEEKSGWTTDLVYTSNRKIIPLRSTDRVVDTKGNYIYPMCLKGIKLPFSFDRERENFKTHRSKMIWARWHDRTNEYESIDKKPEVYRFISRDNEDDLLICSEDYYAQKAQGTVSLDMGGAQVILNDQFFNSYTSFYKAKIYSWRSYNDDQVSEYVEGPYFIGKPIFLSDYKDDPESMNIIEETYKKRFQRDTADDLEKFMIAISGIPECFDKQRPVASANKYMDILAINRKMLDQRRDNFLSREKGDDVPYNILVSMKENEENIIKGPLTNLVSMNRDMSDSVKFLSKSCPPNFVN